MSQFKSFSVGVAIAVSFGIASAGGPATGGASEWTQIFNHMELIKVSADSSLTSISSAQSALNQLEQIRMQIRQLKMQSDNSEGLTPSQLLYQSQQVEGYISQWQNYRDRSTQLNGDLSVQQTLLDNRVAEARLSGGTWDDYVKKQNALTGQAAAQEKLRREREKQVMEQVGDDYELVRKSSAEIESSQGAHQDLQLLNQQMSRLVRQNATMIEMLVQSRNENAAKSTFNEQMNIENGTVNADYLNNRQKAIRQRQEDLLKAE